jgi:hypothetical protein
MPAVLTAALLLLLGGAAPARADEPAGAYDPRDLNQDGTVTGKERRQYRRAHRKHGLGQDSADGLADAQADANAAQTDAAARHSAEASGRASAAANALKSSLPSDDAGGLKAGGPGGSGKAGGKASGDPSDPVSPSDFVLAARSGYAPAFAAAGLKLAADGRSIVRADGSPATAEDYARLRRGILEMPAALGRRPDFFAAVSPGHFNGLKQGYRQYPDLADSVYKHVGTTDGDRDFVHTASCAKMSGDCNASVDKASYKKGDFVAPQDLDRMWGALQKELDDSSNPDGAGPAPRGALKPARSASPAVDAEETTSAGAIAAGGGAATTGAVVVAKTPAASAARYVKRLWRSTTAALGFGGASGDEPSSNALELGALSAAALAALVFALRKKG